MNYAQLDNQERFHLALDALNRDNHTEAIILLKQAINSELCDSRFYYLLGVEYAEIGLYPQAKQMLTQAVEQEPFIEMAAFQLGLLHLTLGEQQQALLVWKKLGHLATTDPLTLLVQGLSALIDDDLANARHYLTLGIQANQQYPVLNKDMQLILDNMMSQQQGVDSSNRELIKENRTSFLLQGYINSSDDE